MQTIDKLFAKKKPAKKSSEEKPEAKRKNLPKKNGQSPADKKKKSVSAEKKKTMAEIMDPAPVKTARSAKAGKTEGLEWVDKFDMSVYENKKVKKIKKIYLAGAVLVCAVGLGAAALYFYGKHNQAEVRQEIVVDGPQQVQDDAQATKEAVGKLMELPADEDPVTATVKDADKVRAQKFFSKAQNGDRVLIYNENQKAILYRPSINKIIEVSSTSELSDGETDAEKTAPAPEQNKDADQGADGVDLSGLPAKVAVYNGSKIRGLAKKIGEKVALTSGITVTEKINASGNYEKTLVVDLSGSRSELAQKIAESLGGETGTLPEGEVKPEADILIIGGSGYVME